MLYKVLNKVFGWDYVAWNNGAGSGIARVLIDGMGTPYYWRYKNIKVVDRLYSPTQVVWLTCHPSKYIEDHRRE